MNIKFQMGDFKITYDDIDLNQIAKVYEKIPHMMFSYYSGLGRVFGKFMGLGRDKSVDFGGRTDIFPASGHDTYNYIARYGIGNFQGQAVLKLDGKLDFGKLSEAVRLSVDEEPVFGCRFVENDPPYWKRRSNLDDIKFCQFEQTEDADAAVKRFLESPLDMDKDPMVIVRLIRSKKNDVLCFKINHACCDGTGMKEYILLIAQIYSEITEGGGTYVPKPKKRGRLDQDRLFDVLGIKDIDAAFIPGSDIVTPTWAFPWKQGSCLKTNVEVCQIPPRLLERMKAFAKSKGATVNDLILAAFYRAMPVMGRTEYGIPMEIPITVDLRRYLPDKKTQAIRNFSGSATTRLSLIENEAMEDTLTRVAAMMREVKRGTPGLQSAIGLERLERISFREILAYYQVAIQYMKKSSDCIPYHGDKCVPTLSNLGYFSRSLVKFGANTVTDAYIVPPVVRPPGFLLMVGTYNDIMTLAGGCYEATARRSDIRRLLEEIRNELIKCCEIPVTENPQ